LGLLPVNVPNLLSLSRILLAPVIGAGLMSDSHPGTAIAVAFLAAAALTDALDGYIARTRSSLTAFGQVVDPIADKVVIAAAFIPLLATDRIPAWVVLVILGREVAVSLLRLHSLRRGTIVSASKLGKLKFDVQLVAAFACMLASDPGTWWVEALLWVAVVATVASGVDYFLKLGRRVPGAEGRLPRDGWSESPRAHAASRPHTHPAALGPT
jgi:CDP-diacylglycerol---glycerol-3-phosphate 3-phosphatidyltransferase